MAQTQIVQARIDSAIKAQAAAVLEDVGLTVSDVMRIVLTRVAKEKQIPVSLLIPNATSRAALQEARENNLPRCNTVSELMEELNEGD